jgi:anti-anti-sigma factor
MAGKEVLMNTNRVESVKNVVLRIKELVRGQEQVFLEELAPTVARESVALDFASVERIDAAGLAALITLYADACKAGHTVTVSRPSRHVREILQIVGLDRILMPRPEAGCAFGNLQMQGSAA